MGCLVKFVVERPRPRHEDSVRPTGSLELLLTAALSLVLALTVDSPTPSWDEDVAPTRLYQRSKAPLDTFVRIWQVLMVPRACTVVYVLLTYVPAARQQLSLRVGTRNRKVAPFSLLAIQQHATTRTAMLSCHVC